MFDFTNVKEVRLSRGEHASPEQGMCFMEMAAWFAGEAHSDKPECVSPALGALGITLNDSMDNEERDRLLKPMIPHVVGTTDEAAERGRIEYMCLRAFNYAIGAVVPEFARRYRGARSFGEAQSMARHIWEEAIHRERSGGNMTAMEAMLAGAYRGDEEHTRRRLLEAIRSMMEWRVPPTPYSVSLVNEPICISAEHPNLANASAAACVFSVMGQIIPDWSAAVDTLREAIKLGRHDGFTASVNLEKRHMELREMVRA